MGGADVSCRFHLFFHFLNSPLIVIVQKCHPFATGRAHTHIPSLGTAYGLIKLDQSQPFVVNVSQRAYSLRIWAIDYDYDLKPDITLT